TAYSLDTSVLISHLLGDRFADETDSFLRRAVEKKSQLVISDIVYAELYTGIYLSSDPKSEEVLVQKLLAVNEIEVRRSGSLKIAKRAGQLYSEHIMDRKEIKRILPDFLIAAQAEATSEAFVTWNLQDYQLLGLKIPVLAPSLA
ncbi:MAG: type II toxin-antitoxin system VapC family toxin, partial [Nitrososphaerales archaeon]